MATCVQSALGPPPRWGRPPRPVRRCSPWSRAFARRCTPAGTTPTSCSRPYPSRRALLSWQAGPPPRSPVLPWSSSWAPRRRPASPTWRPCVAPGGALAHRPPRARPPQPSPRTMRLWLVAATRRLPHSLRAEATVRGWVHQKDPGGVGTPDRAPTVVVSGATPAGSAWLIPARRAVHYTAVGTGIDQAGSPLVNAPPTNGPQQRGPFVRPRRLTARRPQSQP